jgi:hypothetical protein
LNARPFDRAAPKERPAATIGVFVRRLIATVEMKNCATLAPRNTRTEFSESFAARADDPIRLVRLGRNRSQGNKKAASR